MDTPAIPPQAHQSQPRRTSALPASLRFSIRELLLLTTTVAALVAVFLAYYRDSQPFSRSALIQKFGTSSHIRATAAPLQSRTVIDNDSLRERGDQYATTQEYAYIIALPRPVRGEFMQQLYGDSEKLLDDDRRQHLMEYFGGADMSSFRCIYHGGPSRGVLVVRRLDLSDDKIHLSIFIYEHGDLR